MKTQKVFSVRCRTALLSLPQVVIRCNSHRGCSALFTAMFRVDHWWCVVPGRTLPDRNMLLLLYVCLICLFNYVKFFQQLRSITEGLCKAHFLRVLTKTAECGLELEDSNFASCMCLCEMNFHIVGIVRLAGLIYQIPESAVSRSSA